MGGMADFVPAFAASGAATLEFFATLLAAVTEPETLLTPTSA